MRVRPRWRIGLAIFFAYMAVVAVIWVIVDFDYVAAILEQQSWSDFAKSMLDQLKQRGSLSDKQLSYVIGERAPNGKPTMEARVLADNPNFPTEWITLSAAEAPEVQGDTRTEEKSLNHEPVRRDIRDVLRVEGTQAGRSESPQPNAVELIPTAEYPFWKYPFEKFNPVQSRVIPRQAEDRNMVIGANTSAGKTICAEILMDWVLEHGV